MSIFQEFLDIFVDKKPNSHLEICVESLCDKYKKELDEVFFDEIFVGVKYEEILPFLELYKFHSDRSQRDFLAEVFVQIFHAIPGISEYEVIIPMSMHWSRYWIRGFDSMGYLAERISQKSGKICQKILKNSFTKRQVGLSREKRLENRKNIFSVKKMKKIPKKVIIIDDIVTTGTSVNEASRVLKSAGIEEILIVALAFNSK